MKHGLRASKLPAAAKSEESEIYSLRLEVVRELEGIHGRGQVSLYHLALVQSLVRHETRARLAARWLRIEPDLTLERRLALLAAISNATDSRDKALKSLGLDFTPGVSLKDADELMSFYEKQRAMVIQAVQPQPIDQQPADGGEVSETTETESKEPTNA